MGAPSVLNFHNNILPLTDSSNGRTYLQVKLNRDKTCYRAPLVCDTSQALINQQNHSVYQFPKIKASGLQRSCDEYPFASTNEGSWRICSSCVSIRDNDLQGTVMGSFSGALRYLVETVYPNNQCKEFPYGFVVKTDAANAICTPYLDSMQASRNPQPNPLPPRLQPVS